MVCCLNYKATTFLMSTPNFDKLLDDDDKISIEVGFVGYSNSGKSSVINALTFQKRLAKVGKTPGCTRFINLFQVESGVYLIDFPGYGYVQGVCNRRDYWSDVICQYLKNSKKLKGLVVVMDVRNPMKVLDRKLIKNACKLSVPILVLLNKSDKISKSILNWTFQTVKKEMWLTFVNSNILVEVFSVIKRSGVEYLQKKINHWVDNNIIINKK